MQCLKYKTDKQTDLRKIEKLNNVFFSLMATGNEAATTGENFTILVSLSISILSFYTIVNVHFFLL